MFFVGGRTVIKKLFEWKSLYAQSRYLTPAPRGVAIEENRKSVSKTWNEIGTFYT